MKQIILFILLTIPFYLNSQNAIYSKAFGKSTDKALLFIHGGPSGNATLFEYTTAEKTS